MERKQIIMFGGAFNPPLHSHFSLAEQLVNEYSQIEKVIFVPVNSKYKKQDLASNEDRYQMLKLVCDKNEKFAVSRVEIDSPSPLYTIETLKILQKQYPEYEIGFVIGSDNLKELDTWKQPEELIKDFKIYVFTRDRDNIDEIIETNNFLKQHKESLIKAKNNIISSLSSTYVRAKIREKKSIRYLAPDEVIKYIGSHHIYRIKRREQC